MYFLNTKSYLNKNISLYFQYKFINQYYWKSKYIVLEETGWSGGIFCD